MWDSAPLNSSHHWRFSHWLLKGAIVAPITAPTWSYTDQSQYVFARSLNLKRTLSKSSRREPKWLPERAELITEQWLPLWSQSGSFIFLCVLSRKVFASVSSYLTVKPIPFEQRYYQHPCHRQYRDPVRITRSWLSTQCPYWVNPCHDKVWFWKSVDATVGQ